MTTKEQYVYEVYRHRSFTKASQALYVTQPTLSAMVRAAEQELGFRIFDRTASPLELTDAGRVYLTYLENCRANEAALKEQLWETQSCLTGTLTLGATSVNMGSILPLLIGGMLERFPGVAIRPVEQDVVKLQQLLAGGEVELLLDNYEIGETMPEFSYDPLRRERILLALPENDPLCARLAPWRRSPEELRQASKAVLLLPDALLEEVMEREFVFVRHGYAIAHQVETLFARHGKKLRKKLEFDQLATTLSYVRAGIGGSFTSDVIAFSGCPGVSFYPVIENEKRCFGILSRRNRYLSYAAREFISLSRNILADYA